jgi:hypothetical protein
MSKNTHWRKKLGEFQAGDIYKKFFSINMIAEAHKWEKSFSENNED